LPLEHLRSTPQIGAELGNVGGLTAALVKLGLELALLRNLLDCECGPISKATQVPAHRLGRDPSDIAVHVLGHQRRRQATRVLQAR